MAPACFDAFRPPLPPAVRARFAFWIARVGEALTLQWAIFEADHLDEVRQAKAGGERREERRSGLRHRGSFPRPPWQSRPSRSLHLEGAPFVLTGPPAWNSLGLGSTAMWAHSLVYNTKRTGRGGRLDPERLRAMAAEYSTATHRSFLEQAMMEPQ